MGEARRQGPATVVLPVVCLLVMLALVLLVLVVLALLLGVLLARLPLLLPRLDQRIPAAGGRNRGNALPPEAVRGNCCGRLWLR